MIALSFLDSLWLMLCLKYRATTIEVTERVLRGEKDDKFSMKRAKDAANCTV